MIQSFELYIEDIPKRKAKKGTFKKNGHRKYLNSFEIREIINLYPDKFNYELAEAFNVSESAIMNIMRKYGLKKSDEIMDFARFKKGHIPFNKNKSHPVKNSGQFNKGNIPKNHRPVGTIDTRKHNNRDEKYLYIKVSEPNKWKLLHRHIWEQEYGEIPKGMLITFRDHDVLNVDILNLEMISRAENLIRNHNYKKFSKTMTELWRREKMRAKYGMRRQTKLRITA